MCHKIDPEKLSFIIRSIQIASSINTPTDIIIAYYDINKGDMDNMNSMRKYFNLPEIDVSIIKDKNSAWGCTQRDIDVELKKLYKDVNAHHYHTYSRILVGRLFVSFINDSQLGICYHYDPNKESNQPRQGDIILEKLDDESYMLERIGSGMLGIFDTDGAAYDYINECVDDDRDVIVVFSRENGTYTPIVDLALDDEEEINDI